MCADRRYDVAPEGFHPTRGISSVSQTQKASISIDIGGVIIDRWDATDEWSGENYLETPEVEGAFEGVARLMDLFAGRVYLNSAAKGRTMRKTRDWLNYHNFYRRTGMAAGQIHMVPERVDKTIIVQRLGITHHIDDRMDVLAVLQPLVSHLYLFRGHDEELQLHSQNLVLNNWQTWPALVNAIAAELGQSEK